MLVVLQLLMFVLQCAVIALSVLWCVALAGIIWAMMLDIFADRRHD